jgi:hypothetical protein
MTVGSSSSHAMPHASNVCGPLKPSGLDCEPVKGDGHRLEYDPSFAELCSDFIIIGDPAIRRTVTPHTIA